MYILVCSSDIFTNVMEKIMSLNIIQKMIINT